jgi:hypothetical protein
MSGDLPQIGFGRGVRATLSPLSEAARMPIVLTSATWRKKKVAVNGCLNRLNSNRIYNIDR